MKIRTGIEKLGKGMILLIFSIFTIFPFVWMILSALKTKAEIMDVRSFFPGHFLISASSICRQQFVCISDHAGAADRNRCDDRLCDCFYEF